MAYAAVWTLLIAAVMFHGSGCDKRSGDSPSSQAPAASPAAPAKPSPADEEKAAVDSFKAIANKLSERYSKKEIQDPKQSDSLPLDVTVPPESISIKRTGDLVRPFRGEVRGLASLSVPGRWFNDQKPRTLFYDVIWPFNYRDAKWSSDRVSAVAKGEAAEDATLSSMSELVRMRVIMWDAEK